MKKILFFLLIFISTNAIADEGMWLPQLLGKLNESRMKSLGMKISAEDIYSINKGSLKDAIVSFGGFCTGEVISESGLVLTNHHCGFDAIQNHTTLQNNYLRDGFWSKSFEDELTNKGLFVTFIIRIDDVTQQVMKGITPAMSSAERQSMIDKNMLAAKSAASKTATQESFVRGFFEANQYYLFVTETFKDVRLVGAPPSSIGNFGKDTDNWVWPRHTGDFSMFRIYAGKNNEPAEYAADNVPYKPKKSLKVSLDGVAENDFTLIFGFPGRTQQYLPAVAVEQIRTVNDPAKIAVRDRALKIIDAYMRSDEQIKIMYASKYAGIQNAYKKWQGEVLGLTRVDAFAKKTNYEAEFMKRVNANAAWKNEYGHLLPAFERNYTALRPYGLARDYFSEVMSKIELFSIAMQLNSLANTYEKNGQKAYENRVGSIKERIMNTLEEYSPVVDKAVFTSLMEVYTIGTNPTFLSPEISARLNPNIDFVALADKTYADKNLYDSNWIATLLSKPAADAVKIINDNSTINFFSGLQENYSKMVQPELNAIQDSINTLQSIYMKAQMEVMKEKKFYPDANSTMRVSYGQVQGYTARDAVKFDYQTDFEGVMEKYIPGDYEFDVPLKMRELYAKKDYGQYARKDGKLPVCFIATNHTTGGNSGSPALDAYGNLIGLNFDRAWEGTMSDINYDSSICRNIMVDIRYVMFIVDKYADAQRLIKEIKFVHPKAKK